MRAVPMVRNALARGGACLLGLLAAAQGGPRPNLIVIRTDDQDLRSMEVRLPSGEFALRNVRERIVERGVRFQRSFVSFPLCAPSRATLLTGQYAHNHGVESNTLPHGGYTRLDESETLAVWLQRAGYYTAHVGKHVNGYEVYGALPELRVPPGWSRWFTLLLSSAQFRMFDYDVNDDGVLRHFGAAVADYQTDVLTASAVELVTQRPYGAQPFFLSLDYGAPHAAPAMAHPAPRHLGAMNGVALPQPPDFDEADVSDKPAAIRALPRIDAVARALIHAKFRRRIEALLAVDEGVAQLLTRLEQTGQLANTVIVFTSDNGFHLGEHRIRATKYFPYEALRVPLYIRGPGLPVNVAVSQLVSNVDLCPTLLELAGASAALPQDGRSLLAPIRAPNQVWRRELVLENPFDNRYRGLRTYDPSTGREYQYVEYDYDLDGVADEFELYRVSAELAGLSDPFQLTSCHANPACAGLASTLAQRLHALELCAGPSCP